MSQKIVTDQERVESLKRRYGKNHQAPGGPGGRGSRPGGPGRGAGMVKGSPKYTKETIKRLLGYISEEKQKLALAFFCVIVNTLAMLAGS